MKKKFLLMMMLSLLFTAMGTSVLRAANGNVAKVGNTEYATIDEAIAAWTNGTTLTLLADVTLSNVIQLSSTEYHILDLGTYTMTAASGKDAIQYVVKGRSSASYALDIKADANDPGGITATGGSVVRHTKPLMSAPSKDRPITRFYGGVFNANYVVRQGGTFGAGYTGASAPSFYFYDGEYNGTIYTNRSIVQFHGGVFNGSIQMSVDSSSYGLVLGGTFKNLSNSMGSELNSDKFTIGSEKGEYDREVYIDDNGNTVIAADEPSEGIEADVAKTPGTNDYLAYSKVAEEGQLGYTDVKKALNDNKSGTVTVYVEEIDMEGIDFEGTIVVPEGKTVKITNAPAGLKTEGTVVIVKPVAKIGTQEYMTLADALSAASAMEGDVTVEIYEKVTLGQSLSGSYSSIKFVGKDTDAEIYLDVQGYITATGKKVAFEDLTLSKSQGGFIDNAGFMNVAFGVYDVTEVTYTNCVFDNGACASSGKVTYTDCTFKKSWDKYGLWAYGDVDVTVDDCTFADYRGIKMYAEGAAKTVDLKVKDTDFSAVTDKPAIVLTYGEKVTLEGNTYSSTGTFELDLDGAPNGTTVTSDVDPICINDNGACGVLCDGKIYTTVAQAAEVATSGSTVTLLHNSTETVVLPMGVVLDKNEYEAAGVTVAEPIAKIGEKGYTSLQAAIDAVQNGETIELLSDVTENVTVTQKADVKFTIDGAKQSRAADDNYTFTGYIIVDGKSSAYATAGVTIKNLNFDAKGIATDASINLGDEGNINNTRYTSNVTVDNCTFTGENQAKAAVKSYTGGDKNLTITNCTVDATMHSLAQLTNVDGVVIDNCTVNSKNGINLNSSANVVVENSKFEVGGYPVRIGVNEGTSGKVELTNNTLKTDNSEGDAAIVIRGTASTQVELTMTKNIVSGTTHISGTTEATNITADANYWDGQSAPVVAEGSTPVEVDTYYTALNEDGTIDEDSFIETPKGDKPIAYVKEVDGYVRVWGETWGNAKESYALELYSGETKIATTVLNNVGGIINGSVNVTWNFFYPESTDEYWTTTWHEEPQADKQPDKVVLVIDGVAVNEGPVYMSGADGINPVVWADLGGVISGGTWGGIDWTLVDGTLTITPTTGTPELNPNSNDGTRYAIGAWREAVIYNNGKAEAIGGHPYDKSKVKTLIIKEGVISIGSFTAQSFTNLTGEVVIPYTVNYIGQEAFQKSTMTTLTFAPVPEGINGEELCIAQGAFKNLIIEEVSLPADRPVHLHAWVFNNCHNLKNVTIPATVVSFHGTNHIDYSENFNQHSNPTWTHSSEIFAYNENMETVEFGSEEVMDQFYSYNNGTVKDYLKANVGLVTYCNVDDAIDAAKNGGTITLVKNTNAGGDNKLNIPADANITIDLEGKNMTCSILAPNANLTVKNGTITNKDASVSAIEINKGTLTIENVNVNSARHALRIDGEVTATINGGTYKAAQGSGTGTYHAANISGAANVTIEDGTFVGPKGTSADSGSAINVKSGATVTVKNGNYSGGKNSTLNCNGTLQLYGGKYDQDPTAFVADNYVAKKGTDGLYVVFVPVAEIAGIPYATLQEALDAAAAGTGNITVEILDDINLTNVDWNPVTVSAPGYPVVTVNGNDKTITGLNDMLFAGTWAGNSGLIIKDLTIASSNIVNDKDDAKGTVGVGAFIGYPQASATITLNNCHLKDSHVEGGHWTGGLIGMAGGYNGNDGPVFMNLTITGCSVTGSTITGKGSCGGIIGHGSCAAWTAVNIQNTTVSGNTVTSTGSSTNKAGAVMGTIGAAGQPTTANGVTMTGGAMVAATVSGNTVKSGGTAITTIYGRQGTETGILTLTEGGSYQNNPIEENVTYAVVAPGFKLENTNGTYGVVEDPAYGKVAMIGETYYETLSAAFAAVTDDEQTVVILSDVTEELSGAYLRGNITTKDGTKVTITLTNEDWVPCPYTFILGENITLNVPALFYYAGGAQINGTVVAGAYYQRYANTKLTINEPGSMKVTTETFFVRYMDADPNAGIYIIGDNNDETIGLEASVIYFYQGMINAKDADIKVGTYWQTNETDNEGSANLVLDNSNMTVTVNEHNMKATANSTVTLTNGSNVTVAGGYQGVGVSIDATSSMTMARSIFVSKINNYHYTSLQEAVNVGGEVTVLRDIALAEGLTVAADKTVVLDLNGKTISRNTEAATSTAAITNNGNLTIKDSSDPSTGKITAFAANPDTQAVPYYASNTITNCGVLTVLGGTIENSTGDEARAAYPIDNNSTSRDAIVTIEGGKVTGRGAIRQFANSTTHKNEVNVKGGEVSGSSYAIWVQNPNSNDNKAALNIEGGKLSKILISPSAEFDVAITGGELTEVAIWNADETNPERNPSNFISGGTFTQNMEEFCVEGYKMELNENGTYGVVPFETKEYVINANGEIKTLADAIAKAKEDGTDIVTYTIYGAATLETGYSHGIVDFGGREGYITIQGGSDNTRSTDSFKITGGGVPDIKGVTFKDLTFYDEGEYLTTANEFMYQNFIDCKFENVTFEDGIRLSGNSVVRNCTFNANTNNEYAIWLDEGTFEMTGSTVTAGNDAYGLLKSDEVDKITISDNTFQYLAKVNKEALNVKGAIIVAEDNTFIDCAKGVVPKDKTNYTEDGTTPITNEIIAQNNTVVVYVAKINGTKYESLAAAATAAQDGETIQLLWAEGHAPIAMNASLYGNKNVTITGTATVDWNNGFLFVGRGGEGNATLTFDGANLTSASNSSSYGIHVSGREKNTNDKYNGTLVINNSTIDLDYLINKGTMTLDESTLTVKNGFSVGGRPAGETESGGDATATITLNNNSKVVVNNHNGMGLGYEAIGIMNIDVTSTFETTESFLVTAKGTMNVNGGNVKVVGTLTNNGAVNVNGGNVKVVGTLTNNGAVNVNGGNVKVDGELTNNGAVNVTGESILDIETLTENEIYFLDGAIIKNSTIGGEVFVAGKVIFRGNNTFAMLYDFGTLTDEYGTTANMEWTVEEGASLTLTKMARYGLGYGDNVTINGSITEALEARENLTEDDRSLFMHGLVAQESSGWNCNSKLTVKDAYVVLGSNNSFGNKPGNYGGNYTFNFNNSVVDGSRITFYEASSITEFTFEDSDVKIGTFMTRDTDSKFTLKNSKVLSTTENNGTDEGNYNAGELTLLDKSSLTYSAAFTNTGTLNLDLNSKLTAPSVAGNGTINIDATDFNGNEICVISANMASFEGVINVEGAHYMKKDNGIYVTGAQGTLTKAYTSATGYWGECGGNANESFVLKFYNDNTYMGQTSLNDIDNIIDGDVYVTWSIDLNIDPNAEGYWAMSWYIRPTLAMQPNRVEQWIDGEKVAECAVEPNWADNIFPVVAAVTDENDVILSYVNNTTGATLNDAFAAGGNIAILRDFNLAESVTVPADKTVVLNLNGYTISQEKACTASYQMIENKGALTIKDSTEGANGKISFKDTSAGDPTFGWGSYTVRNEGTLVVENGTIEHLGAQNQQSNVVHMYCAIFQYSGSSTINDGTISTPTYRSVRLWKDDMTINGGTFEGQVWVQCVDDSAELTINGGNFSPRGGDGSSVFVGNVTNAGVHYPAGFTVTGGTFVTKIGCNDATKLTGGRIIGGLFSQSAVDNTNEALLGDGFEFVGTADANGYYTVIKTSGTFTRTLSSGWSWFSYYIDIEGSDGFDALKEDMGEACEQFKSQTAFTFYSNNKWYIGPNALTGTNVEDMYMVKMRESKEISLSGKLAVPAEEKITLNANGWTWIGYPLENSINVSDALATFNSIEGDYIKSKTLYAEYVKLSNGTYAWKGSLNSMIPGEGYKYKSVSGDEKVVYYSSASNRTAVKANVTSENNYWVASNSKYSSNMTVVAMMSIDNEIVNDSYEIAAFANGECRGSARAIYDEDLNAYMLYLTIHGEDVENITFKYYDVNYGTEYELGNVVVYSSDAILGSINNPYMFNLDILNVDEASINEVNVYPNPTTTNAEIDLNATCDKVEVFNALGVKVAEYSNVDSIDALETAGVYVIRVTIDGNVRNCRLVVK